MVWISQIFGCDILDNYPNQACVRHTETIQTVPIQIELIQITPQAPHNSASGPVGGSLARALGPGGDRCRELRGPRVRQRLVVQAACILVCSHHRTGRGAQLRACSRELKQAGRQKPTRAAAAQARAHSRSKQRGAQSSEDQCTAHGNLHRDSEKQRG